MRSKLLPLLLCLCLALGLFTACKERDRTYNEAEVTAAARALIEKSKILNEIYWGAGIPFVAPEEGEESGGVYRPADPEYLKWLKDTHGIASLADLKEKTREVYSAAGYASIVSSRLGEGGEDDGQNLYVRYYESKKNDDVGAIDAWMVYTRADNFYENTESVDYIYDGMTVSDVEGEYLTVSLKVKTKGKDGSESTRDFTVRLIEEEGGYRLSGATYAPHPAAQN